MAVELLLWSVKMTVIVLMLFWAHSTVLAGAEHEVALRDSGNATHNHTGSSSNESLSGEAIANIVATAAAIALIGSMTCYMCYCYNHRERMARVKAAIERNKLIRQRIEAEKKAASTIINEQPRDIPSPVTSATSQQFAPT